MHHGKQLLISGRHASRGPSHKGCMYNTASAAKLFTSWAPAVLNALKVSPKLVSIPDSCALENRFLENRSDDTLITL